MRKRADHETVERLLQDESLSFREIARRANCSDWTVRSIARRQSGVESYDGLPEPEPLTAGEWAIVVGIGVLIVGGMCFLAWRMAPLDSESM